MLKAFETEVRVRFAETDMWGIVYYANFFVWFEVGRGAAFREINIPVGKLQESNAMAVVVEASCRYRSSARYDDLILIRTTISSLQPKLMTFTYEILNKETGILLATGHTKHVFVNKEGKSARIPEPLAKLIREKCGLKPRA